MLSECTVDRSNISTESVILRRISAPHLVRTCFLGELCPLCTHHTLACLAVVCSDYADPYLIFPRLYLYLCSSYTMRPQVYCLSSPILPASIFFASTFFFGRCSGGDGLVKSPMDWPFAPVPDLQDALFGLTGGVFGPLREAMDQYFSAGASDVTRAGATAIAVNATARGGAMAVGRKPSLFLVAGDALGARLIGWCQVACRSPQWRGLFSKRRLSVPALPPPAVAGSGDGAALTDAVAGKKRPADDMEASAAEREESDGTQGSDGAGGREGRADPSGLAQLLFVVGQIVHAVKEHTKVLAAARDRASGVGFFDFRTRDTSALVQELVGALAGAILDVFGDHVADPTFHSLLRQDTRGVGESARGVLMSDVVLLEDGASSAEVMGLSVDVISDIAWLFSALEVEGPNAALLSSSMACWASGRLLACMPGREQLEYAVGLGSSTAGGGAVRPLPARLAAFAVRTLLENITVAREKESEAPAEPVKIQEPLSVARTCAAGSSTASSRVALITEQLPAWRDRRQRWERQQPVVGEAACNPEAVAATAGQAAATEVLDILVALMCAAAEHDRPSLDRQGALRRPTMYTAGSIGTLVGTTLQALLEILGQASPTRGGRSGSGGGPSTRSAFLNRGKKRRGSSPSGADAGAAGEPASSNADKRWTTLVGQRLISCLDRVHVAGMLLAWDSWHPWMEKAVSIPSAGGSVRQTRSWQTFCSLTGQLAKACVSPRPAPPPGEGLAALVVQTVLTFGTAGRGVTGPMGFMDAPALLFLCKVSVAVEISHISSVLAVICHRCSYDILRSIRY